MSNLCTLRLFRLRELFYIPFLHYSKHTHSLQLWFDSNWSSRIKLCPPFLIQTKLCEGSTLAQSQMFENRSFERRSSCSWFCWILSESVILIWSNPCFCLAWRRRLAPSKNFDSHNWHWNGRRPVCLCLWHDFKWGLIFTFQSHLEFKSEVGRKKGFREK